MFLLLGISYLPLLLPFSLIFGLLFGHGKLSSQSEFTALASFGITKLKMSQPAIIFSALCLFTCFNSIHTWGPNAKYQSRALKNVIMQKIAATAFQPGVFLTQIPGVTMYAEGLDGDKKLSKVFILNESKNDNFQVFANNGEFLGNGQSDTSFGLKLFNGVIYNNSRKDLSSLMISFRSYVIELFESKKTNSSLKRQINNSTTKQLKQRLQKSSPKKSIPILIEINKRNMFALSCVFFLVIGTLFSLRLHNRSSKGGGFFLAILMSLFFWIMLFVSEFLSNSHQLPLLVYLPIVPCTLFCIASYVWIKLKSIN